ncbi:MAG: HpaA family protein, partial [Gallionella sp.]
MRKLLGMITAGVLLSGCATQIPVHKDVGTLSMNYQTKEVGASTGLTVAIVSPEFAKNAPNSQLGQDGFSANTSFDGSYKGRLVSAIQSTMEELISKRGFTTKGPFTALDEINYGDKKSMYLISTPKLTINLKQERTEGVQKGMVYTEKGEIRIGGELTFKLIEPLTGQSMMTKRIDLSSLIAPKIYTKQYQTSIDPVSVAGMIAKSQAPESLEDNTDRAMTDAVNEFYQQAMT